MEGPRRQVGEVRTVHGGDGGGVCGVVLRPVVRGVAAAVDVLVGAVDDDARRRTLCPIPHTVDQRGGGVVRVAGAHADKRVAGAAHHRAPHGH